MFDKSIIKAAASGLVGFNYSTHKYYEALSDYKTSDSGYWVNSLAGADFSTIEATLPSKIQNIPLIVGEKYIIRASGGVFTNVGAADNNIGTTFTATGTNPSSWGDSYLELQSCNKYIETIYNEEVVNVMSKFLKHSKHYLKQNTLLSNTSVIEGVADMTKLVTKSSRFVGFILNPYNGNNVVNTITKIGFLGNTAENFTIYLYETSQKEPIATFTFDYDTPYSQKWQDIANFIVKYDNTRTITTGQGSSVKSYSNTDNNISVSAGSTVNVTFDVPFTDNDYALNITLYNNSGSGEPYQVTNRTKDGFSIKALVDITLDYIAVKTITDTYSTSTYSGGIGQKYILGYYEDDLSGQAVELEFNQSLKHFNAYGKFLTALPIEIPSSKLDGTNLPLDVLNITNYRSDYTHGLYFKFTANCDYTNLLEDNIELFSEAIQYSLAIRVLQDAISSVTSGIHNSVKDASISEWRKLVSKYTGMLNGGNIMIGEALKYEPGLIELLTLDFSNIDNVCMKYNPNEWEIGNLI